MRVFGLNKKERSTHLAGFQESIGTLKGLRFGQWLLYLGLRGLHPRFVVFDVAQIFGVELLVERDGSCLFLYLGTHIQHDHLDVLPRLHGVLGRLRLLQGFLCSAVARDGWERRCQSVSQSQFSKANDRHNENKAMMTVTKVFNVVLPDVTFFQNKEKHSFFPVFTW